jgi:hypothetical protein
MTNQPGWNAIQPALAPLLADARQQLHHAAQFATAMGISYLPHAADDSHTNLEWLAEHWALASNTVPGAGGAVRLAVRVPDLTLHLMRDGEIVDTTALRGQTIASVADSLRPQLDALGLEGSRYTLKRHYEIPPHAVAAGAMFAAEGEHLQELARWFGDAALVLDSVRSANNGSTVRCWPHHFDIATLVTVREGTTVGVGMEPGDGYYNEPYFYVNASPQPSIESVTATLAGNGLWNTKEWIGAVLSASRVTPDVALQEEQVRAFLESAVRIVRSLVV